MTSNKIVDVIIIGGSYAGLSAAMALGRSLRNVLIIDNGKPCNIQTPHSHNFITHDGKSPEQITTVAKEQVLNYDTIKFLKGTAITGKKTGHEFEIHTEAGEIYTSGKLLFASGIADQLPLVKGFSACWGISVLHCPYCHGYEVKGNKIGLIGNGELGFEMCRLIHNWSKDLMLFTNGKSNLTGEQEEILKSKHIEIVEEEIVSFEHSQGYIKEINLSDGSGQKVTAVFTRVGFKQHCLIPEELGCELTDQGYIKVDNFTRTTVKGVFAAGDSTTMMRAVSVAVAAGTMAGACINKELIEEQF